MRRRRFVQGGAASGAVLLARPGGALAGTLSGGTRAQVADRASRLFPGSFLVHADMHNHSLFSDGDGDPSNAFVSMRDHGLDVAALTDHAVLGGALGLPFAACGTQDCKSIQGIDASNWADAATFADDADAPGSFVAVRGFEWSSPTLGHMNVWFSDEWVDPERTAGLVGVEGIELLTDQIPVLGPLVGEPLADLVGALPTTGLTMRPFFDWLRSAPGSGVLGGGMDGIAGFNHPGREPGRFGLFTFDERLVDQVVSMEIFNREEDYLFEGTDTGEISPLVHCLEAGWRPGLLGVTDEHGTDWGGPLDKGRAGVWVDDLSRTGVRHGLERRSFFATRERGLRIDAAATSATAAGGRVRMGGDLGHDAGAVRFELDVDKGDDWVGKPLLVQVLRPGTPLPAVLDTVEIVVPSPDEPVVAFSRDLRRDEGGWVVLRVTDPDGEPDGRATGDFVEAGRAVAYTSPFYLVPADGAAPTTTSTTSTTVPVTVAGAGGAGLLGPGGAGAGGGAGGAGGVGLELPRTGGSSLLGGGAALGAAALAALAARRATVRAHTHPDHDHDHGEPGEHPHPH